MWGHTLKDRIWQSDDAKYDFTGKERDTETGYDYFGARYYNSRIGRWGGVDKMHDKGLSWTPYKYGNDNPLNFIDIDGNIEIPKEQQQKYPKLTEYIKNKIIEVTQNAKIMDAIKETSSLTDQQIKDALTWGQGPKINVTQLGATDKGKVRLGEFSMDIKSDELRLDIDMVEDLENSTESDNEFHLLLVSAVILHELVHWGEDQTGTYNMLHVDEAGEKFEELAYGRRVNSFKSAKEVYYQYVDKYGDPNYEIKTEDTKK